MIIEGLTDPNCLSLDSLIQIKDRLITDFPGDDISLLFTSPDSERIKKLGVWILPKWLVNNQVLEVDPFHYQAVKNGILKIAKEL